MSNTPVLEIHHKTTLFSLLLTFRQRWYRCLH